MEAEENDSNITNPAPRLEESVVEREREGSHQATHLVLQGNAFPPTIPATPKFIPYTTNSSAVSDTTSTKSLFEPLTIPPYIVRRRTQKDRMGVIADAFKQNVSRPLDWRPIANIEAEFPLNQLWTSSIVTGPNRAIKGAFKETWAETGKAWATEMAAKIKKKPPSTTPHPLVRSTFKQLMRSSGQSFPPPTTPKTISRPSISQRRRKAWEPRPPKPWLLARSQIQNQLRKKMVPNQRIHSRLVDPSRRYGMLRDQLLGNSSTRERAEPAAKALISSPEYGFVDTEMHGARVVRQRSDSRVIDPSRRDGMTPEQFASFRDQGRFPNLPGSPTKVGRPAANALKASRSRSFPRGEPIQQFKLKVNNKYQRLGHEATGAREHDGPAQWNFDSHGKNPYRSPSPGRTVPADGGPDGEERNKGNPRKRKSYSGGSD